VINIPRIWLAEFFFSAFLRTKIPQQIWLLDLLSVSAVSEQA